MMISDQREERHMRAEWRAGNCVYLDYNATAPLRPAALEAMLPHLHGVGNASSVHAYGRSASDAVRTARQRIAHLIGCSPGEVVFTSGATEANNLALGAAASRRGTTVTTPVEHPSVLVASRAFADLSGGTVTMLIVNREGLTDPDELSAILSRRDVNIVSVMAANNETGVLSDLAGFAEVCRGEGVLLHTDATQMVGRLPINVTDLDVDLLSLSAHKFGGPQGVGALFIRRDADIPFRPAVFGGGQEGGWRAGTLNVAGIVGAGAAAAATGAAMTEEARRVKRLRDRFEAAVLDSVAGVEVNGHPTKRLPGVSNLMFPGLPADAMLSAMTSIAASDGSACSAGAQGPSHVLTAMGRTRDEADCSIRFSLGYATTEQEIEIAIAAVSSAARQIRIALRGESPNRSRLLANHRTTSTFVSSGGTP